jgi:hypothetical protein
MSDIHTYTGSDVPITPVQCALCIPCSALNEPGEKRGQRAVIRNSEKKALLRRVTHITIDFT